MAENFLQTFPVYGRIVKCISEHNTMRVPGVHLLNDQNVVPIVPDIKYVCYNQKESSLLQHGPRFYITVTKKAVICSMVTVCYHANN